MTSTTDPAPETLRVIIVGSGIAGLAAARVLRSSPPSPASPRAHITIYERNSATAAVHGQGIATPPNGTKVLDLLGFDRGRAGAVEMATWRANDKQGRLIRDAGIPFRQRFGAPVLTHMRTDLRDELLRLATCPAADVAPRGDDGDDEGGIGGLGPVGEPAELVFGNAVVDLDAESGVVTLSDGSTDQGDVIIVADGIHSKLRPRMLGPTSHGPRKTGMACFRIAVSAAEARSALGGVGGRLPGWWEAQLRTQEGMMFLDESLDGTHRLITVYPLRRAEYMNISCVFPTRRETDATTFSWNADGDRAEMLDLFRDFDADLVALMRVAEEVKTWEFQDLDPLPAWASGRAIAIGDAAHAMTPLQGQGAAVGLEDAEALRLLMQPGVRRGDIGAILKVVERARRPRAAQVLENTRKATRITSPEERWAVLDENCTYGGIFEAIKQFQ
ncbi:FAD binding domain protein [Xylariomycetidae sp. FL2044]|nr:FAD binding domain protein [Xylariomycetidae sp. FL2044]